MLAGRSTLSPVITIISVESWSPHGSGGDRKLLSGSIAVRCSVTYPTGYSATALKFAQDLETGHCTWLTTMFINANIWNATFHGGSVPRMASPPPPPPAYVPPDALPGTPSLPTDVQVQDVPPGIRNKPHHLTSGLAHPATSVNASLRSACNKDCCAIDSILARSVAALFKQATKGCTLLTGLSFHRLHAGSVLISLATAPQAAGLWKSTVPITRAPSAPLVRLSLPFRGHCLAPARAADAQHC